MSVKARKERIMIVPKRKFPRMKTTAVTTLIKNNKQIQLMIN